MIIYINNNDAIINNNYGRLRDLILLFRIPMGMPALVYKFTEKPYNNLCINVG